MFPRQLVNKKEKIYIKALCYRFSEKSFQQQDPSTKNMKWKNAAASSFLEKYFYQKPLFYLLLMNKQRKKTKML